MMKKILAILLIGVLTLGMMLGCRKVEEPTPQEPQTNQEVQEGTNEEEQNKEVAEGVYTGQVDNNSIEIEVDGEAKVFMMYDVASILGDIEEQDRVRVEYEENEQGQLMILKLEEIQ